MKAAPVHPSTRKAPPEESATPKFTFRPPNLSEVSVVADPFERAGPRLRIMEYFSRELSS